MSTPVLEIANLYKSFGKLEVLKGINLTLQKGDVVSLIGSSGSGKTTLLRCVNMLEDFEKGTITVAGEQIGYVEKTGKRRRLPEKEIARQRAMTGMAFQHFNLFPHMSALGNVTLGLIKTRRMSKDEAHSIAKMVGKGRDDSASRPVSRTAFRWSATAGCNCPRDRNEPATDVV